MKNHISNPRIRNLKLFLPQTIILFSLLAFFNHANAQNKAATATTPVGTTQIWGKVDGVEVEGLVQGPSAAVAPLQIACVFEYTEGDIYNSPPALPVTLNGMVHLDKALNGLITDLRKSGKFAGHAYETLLITPPAGTLAAKQLLLIGLGDRTKFNAGLMTGVGKIAMRESLMLGVTTFSFASRRSSQRCSKRHFY